MQSDLYYESALLAASKMRQAHLPSAICCRQHHIWSARKILIVKLDFLYSVFIVFNRSASQLIQTLLRWDVDLLTALTMTGFRRLTFVLAIMIKKSQISDGRCNAGAENSDHEVPVHGCVPTSFNFILSLQSSQLWQNFRLRHVQTWLLKCAHSPFTGLLLSSVSPRSWVRLPRKSDFFQALFLLLIKYCL